jgi:hypothetical protein
MPWNRENHINFLELNEAHLAIMTFVKFPPVGAIYLIQFLPFPENDKLCVCRCINAYLRVLPHKAISTRSISRWLMDTISRALIKTLFLPTLLGRLVHQRQRFLVFSTKEILKKAFWSTSSTLRGFIVRKLLSISKIFKEQFWPRNICSVL